MSNQPTATNIFFHPNTFGQNIGLDDNASRASRHTSFDNGITFTNRRIKMNERICMRIIDNDETGQWLGSLAVGFTQKDPATIQQRDLLRSALPTICQQTTVSYVKRIFEKLTRYTIVIFYYNEQGAFYILDGKEQEIGKNIDVSKPLWGIIDLYGNVRGAVLITLPTIPVDSKEFFNKYNQKPDKMTNRYFTQLKSTDLQTVGFHDLHGPELELYCMNQVVFRKSVPKLSRPYLFLHYPMRPGDQFYIRILCVDYNYRQPGVIGFTNAVPSSAFSNIDSLPADDPSALYDRKEFWIVNEEGFDHNIEELDEYRFVFTEMGEIDMWRNNETTRPTRTVAFVDPNQPFYPFFFLNGRIKALSIIGVASSRETVYNATPKPKNDDDADLCQMCYDAPANLVMIPCGHLFFCSSCRAQYESKSAKRCPKCRREYQDCFEIASD